MTAALFADYLKDLKILLDDIDAAPEKFRTFDVHIDLAHKGLLFVYETKRKLGQTDSIYYARMAKTGTNKQVSQQTAYAAVSAFVDLGQFVALTGDPGSAATGQDPDERPAADGDYPSCAVTFSYRKTGMPKAMSTRMVFLGFGSDSDALAHAQAVAETSALVKTRPFHSERVWEWR